jgi:hypothetical protein
MTIAEKLRDKIGAHVSTHSGYLEAVAKLKEIVAGLQEAIDKDGHALIFYEAPGSETDWGVQYRIMAHKLNRDFKDTLARIYIPLNGYPIKIDFDGDTPLTCHNAQEFEDTFVEEFGKSLLLSRVIALRDL